MLNAAWILSLPSFQPVFWARGGHAQTILGHLLRKSPHLAPGENVEIKLPDDDALAATFYPGKSDTVVYLFHGLSGDTEAAYMARSAKLFTTQGHSVLMINHRGCGHGRKILHRKPYHSGRAEDLAAAIAWGRSREPNKKHFAIGFSLSGNALLLLLSGKRGDTLPDAAITVNAPIRLMKASLNLQHGLNRVYDFRFVQQCRKEVEFRKKKGWISLDIRIPRLATVYDLDALYTAPEGGFASREDYYETCSTADLLNQIKTPTLLIMAQDDPFVDASDYLQASLSPSVHLILTESGGHMGYLARGKHWFQVFHWFESVLGLAVEGFRLMRYQ